MSDFNGKSAEKKPVARYMVTISEEPNKVVAFDVAAKSLARDIQFYYNKGFAELEITRENTSLVSYKIVPVIARQKQQQMMKQE